MIHEDKNSFERALQRCRGELSAATIFAGPYNDTTLKEGNSIE